jgi:hypothetical protein
LRTTDKQYQPEQTTQHTRDAAMISFLEDLTRDIPRGLSSRYLKQQTAPHARWRTPEVIVERKALDYDPHNPGRKILIGAFGPKLIGIDDNRHVLAVAGSRAGGSGIAAAPRPRKQPKFGYHAFHGFSTALKRAASPIAGNVTSRWSGLGNVCSERDDAP